MPANPSIPLYLFAKAPEPGRVKTRMQPYLDPETCAALAAQMLEDSARQVSRFWPGRRILCVTPHAGHPHFDRLSREADFEVTEQIDADLGDRMIAAIASGLSQSGSAMVMGCDVPHLDGAILEQAWTWMQGGHNVIGPALDGGFYLLGCHGLPVPAFKGVEWGSSSVLETVVRQAKQGGMAFSVLPELQDIDRPSNLRWLAQQDNRYRRFIPDRVIGAHG